MDVAFAAASGVMKWDISLMTFLLPHVVLTLVTRGDAQAIEGALDEINAVMKVRGIM